VEPQDIIWRILRHLGDFQEILEESLKELHPKKHGDLISSIHECEQLTKTQVNIMNRTAKRY
jgi:AICAR transformylase/IMP cyclohydrolase PurH